MLGFMMDRRALALSASCITAGIFVFLIATYPSWKAAVSGISPWNTSVTPDVVVAEAGKSAPLPIMAPVAVAPKTTPPPVPNTAADVPASTAGAQGPSFDVVRVEPTGESVIAARGTPGAEIVLLDGGRPIARAKADSSGQVAFLPPILAPGEHSLMLSVGEPNSPNALSSQSVAVSVSGQPHTAPMVALIQPDQPAKVLSEPMAVPSPVTGDKAAASRAQAAPLPVAISTIEIEDAGSFYATGKAAPGSHCRVYLNGSFVATVTAGGDGAWSLKIKRGMKPGHYVVRADQVDSSAGQVQARAEVPFDYPARGGRAMSLLRPKPGSIASASPLNSSSPLPQSGSGGSAAGQRMASMGSTVPTTSSYAANATGAGGSAAQSAQAANFPTGSIAVAPSGMQLARAASPGGSSLASTVIAQLLTAKVIRGDSLWRISRKILGNGERYTQIYAANTTQIRDPRLIYPGQIFVMPQVSP